MFAIDNNTASTTLPPIKPVGIPGFFTAGTVGGVPATIVEADWLNQVQSELLAVLAAASIAPSKGQNNQLIQAILWLIANNTRQRLTGPLNLYVNIATGSDTNNGLTPTTAFATPQAAWNYIMLRLDTGGQQIIVNIADGSYPPLLCEGAPVGLGNSGSVIFSGDQVSPSSVVINQPNGIAVQVAAGALVHLTGMRLQAGGNSNNAAAAGTGLVANNAGIVTFSNIDFGTCSSMHMGATQGGMIASLGAPYSISGNSPVHAWSSYSSGGLSLADSPVTIYNTPTFSEAFMMATLAASCEVWGMVFNGAAHGKRYWADTNGVIVCRTNPDTYFPGDVAGTKTNGGQVV